MPENEQKPIQITVPVGLIDPYKENLEERIQLWFRIPRNERRKIKSIFPEDGVVQVVLSKLWQELVLVCEKNDWKDFTSCDEFCEFVNNMTVVKKQVKPTKKNGQPN